MHRHTAAASARSVPAASFPAPRPAAAWSRQARRAAGARRFAAPLSRPAGKPRGICLLRQPSQLKRPDGQLCRRCAGIWRVKQRLKLRPALLPHQPAHRLIREIRPLCPQRRRQIPQSRQVHGKPQRVQRPRSGSPCRRFRVEALVPRGNRPVQTDIMLHMRSIIGRKAKRSAAKGLLPSLM